MNSEILIYDDLVSNSLKLDIWNFIKPLSMVNIRPGSKVPVNNEKAVWNLYQQSNLGEEESFLKAGLGHFMSIDSPIKELFELISSTLFDNKLQIEISALDNLPNVYINGQYSGQDGCVHADNSFKESRSLLYYPISLHQNSENCHWDPNWGGELIIYDDDKEIIKSILPKPNRLVVFDGTIKHRGCAPTKYFGESMRISMAYKCVLGR